MNKTCFICKELLPISKFWKDKSRKDGYDNKCMICDRKQIKYKITKINELKKMKYPLGTVLTEQYTNGKRFHLNNKPYIGWFYTINGEFFTGKQPGPFSKKLIQFQKEFPNKNKIIQPNKVYYIKKINEGFAKSVSSDEFKNYINNPLYKTVSLDKNNIEEINEAKKIIPELNLYFK